MAAGAGVLAAVLIVLGLFPHAQAQTAHLESADCPADGAGATHSNSVYDAALPVSPPPGQGVGVPTAGPKFPAISSRPTRSYGAVGSCVGSAAEGFDGGEIVVGATIPLYGPRATSSYAKIMRFTIEIFLDWLNHERIIPGQELRGGLMIGGKRHSMRFAWTDDKQEAADAAPAIASSTRRSNAHFGWGGYGSTISRLQAEQAELDGFLFMASIAADVRVFQNRSLTFGALPPDYTYIKNAVRAVADAATGEDGIPAANELKVGLVYQAPLDGMCAEIAELAVGLGMSVASRPWRGDGRNGVPRHPKDPEAPGERQVDSVLRGLRDDGVNFVVGCVYHDGGEAIIESLERLDYSPHAAAFTSTVDISAYQSRVDAGWWQGEYALGVSPWHSSLTHAGEFSGMTSAEYLERYQSHTGETPSYHGPAAFSAACALAKAIEDAGSLNATNVAASLANINLLELGFYTPMTFSSENDGQNTPEMLVVQFPPRETDLKIVYPADRSVQSSSLGAIQFPTPKWGKRRCQNVGSGVTFGGAPPENPVNGECNGNGECVFDHDEVGHEVWVCECDPEYFGDWVGPDCNYHIWDGVAIFIYFLILLMVGGCVFVYFYRLNRKKRAKERRAHALKIAEDELKKAVEKVKKEFENKKAGMTYPEIWDRDPGTATEEQPEGMPVDDLIEIPHDSPEYWDVVDKLRADPEPSHARGNSQRRGMHDAWITKLQRIQNTDLYAYNQFQKERVPGDDTVEGWHGTGTFPAENIYNDRQDGFMMQFASQGQWGSGLYFAKEAGYSHIYASRGSKMPYSGMKPDESEMMLASLLTGKVVELDRDSDAQRDSTSGLSGQIPGIRNYCKKLKVPPFVGGTRSTKGPDGVDVATAVPGNAPPGNLEKYNTVRGYTQTDKNMGGQWSKNEDCPRSQVWIVYENGRAYPKYLVRYYRGPYDRSRVTCQQRPLGQPKTKGAHAAPPAEDIPVPAEDIPVPAPLLAANGAPLQRAYYSIGPSGEKDYYESEDNESIAQALASGEASIQLPPKQYGSFEIRFQAPWGKFSKRPDSGIIQINSNTGATRAVAWADAGRP